jgi:L-rhamnose 1-dehydrogenase
MRLTGKVALVTGGTRGIGLAVSESFAREGATVVMASVDSEEQLSLARESVAALAAPGCAPSALRCDVADPAQIVALVSDTAAQHGRIDILVNNAGVGGFGSFFDMSLEEWQHIVDVNYRAVFLCSREVARVMIDQHIHGRIITTSSLGVFTGSVAQFHYSSTKAAIHNLMQSLAVILGPYGITCNSVAPALILTEMSRPDLEDPIRRQSLVDRTPVRRVGQPADVAAAFAYFASDESAFTTGAFIRVDGGLFINV